jgi:hypothetical protein
MTTCIAFAQEANNTFSNATFRFSVTKPVEWQFVTVDQHLENLERTLLSDPEMQEVVQKYANAPLVVMMKYPEPFDDLNPTFKANIKPLGNLSADDPVAILKLVIRQM